MPYSSSLTDREWDVLEPLLAEILPQKKRTRPTNWTKRDLLDGIFYQLKNGCNWKDLPKDLPPYSTVYWHYKQWRQAGAIEKLMSVLHGQVREQVKKKPSGQRWSSLTRRQSRILAMRVWSQKGSASTKPPTGLNGIWQWIRWAFHSSRTAQKPMFPMMGDWLRCWSKTSSIFVQSRWIFPRLPSC